MCRLPRLDAGRHARFRPPLVSCKSSLGPVLALFLAGCAAVDAQHRTAPPARADERRTGRTNATTGVVARTGISVDGVVGGDDGFALWSADGRVEIRDLEGALVRTTATGLQGLAEVTPTRGGWLARGSSFQGQAELGAIALVGSAGNVSSVWTTPGIFWSVASNGMVRIATDHLGNLFTLAERLLPLQPPHTAALHPPFQLRFWDRELVMCTTGSRRLAQQPTATCVRDSQPLIQGIWQVAPIACDTGLVADVQQDGRATSPWTRAVWDAKTGSLITRKPIATPSAALVCTGATTLVDTSPPGHVLELPSLTALGESLCPAATTRHLGVTHDRILCVDVDGSIGVRELVRNAAQPQTGRP
jgi:hypothetical protein